MANIDLASLQARLQADPGVQQALQLWQGHGRDAASGRGHGVSPGEVSAQQAARQAGMPEGYYLGPDGTVKPLNGMGSTLKAWALLGGAAAPFVAPGLLAGGGSSALAPGTESGSYIGSDVASTAAAASGGHGILGTAADVLLGRGSGNTALDTAGRVGRGLLGIEADRQAGRESEAQATQAQDRNQIAAANVNLTAGSRRGAQSVQGDVLAHAQPFEWTTGADGHLGYTGGLSPSLFSDTTRKLGTQLSSDALNAQTADHGSPVNLTPLPQGSATDSILSTAGRIGGLMGLIPYKRPQQPVPTGWA